MESELDRICQNCGCFTSSGDDLEKGIGICWMDDAFDPFWDEVADADFSNCHDLYLEKQFDGERKGCDEFAVPEMLDVPEGWNPISYIILEEMECQNIDELIKYLYHEDSQIVNNAVDKIAILRGSRP